MCGVCGCGQAEVVLEQGKAGAGQTDGHAAAAGDPRGAVTPRLATDHIGAGVGLPLTLSV